jgi:hypothetical protein
MRRRQLLGAVAVTLVTSVSGCADVLGGDVEHGVSTDAWRTADETERATPGFRGEVRLPAGRYAARTVLVAQSTPVTVRFDTDDGERVDVYLLTADAYETYRDRETVTPVDSLSASDAASGTLSGTLSDGEYRLVVDNTGAFGADPDGVVRVDVEVTTGRASTSRPTAT